MSVMQGLYLYLLAVNLLAFALYGVDKYKAKRKMWRIPEKVLLGIAVVGGSVGAIAGMKTFHHKTKHWYFRYGLPVLLAVQLALVYWFFLR